MAESQSNFVISGKLYDRMKFVAQILLPAIATLYFTLAQIWGLPAADKVVGTISAVDFFLGAILGISSNQYYKNGSNFDGTMHVTAEKKPQLFLELNPEAAEDLPGKHSVEFNVHKVSPKE